MLKAVKNLDFMFLLDLSCNFKQSVVNCHLTYDIMTLTISIISLIISGLTFWLTRIRKGTLKMTRPSIICFLGKNGIDEPKIFIRTLLYSTSDQGQYIQNMFIRLHRAETIQNFNVWAYGDNGLVRGSGLFVSKGGVSNYHHFLLPKNEQWDFVAGEYKLEVIAETVNKLKSDFSDLESRVDDLENP